MKLDYWREKYLIPAIRESRESGKTIALLGTGDPDTYRDLERSQGVDLTTIFDPLRLRESGAKYTVFDINPVQIEKLQQMGVEAEVCDITQSTLPKKYDLIFASDVIEHVENPIAMMRNLKDSLADGGSLVLTTPNANYWRNFVSNSYVEFHEHNFAMSEKHFRNVSRRLGIRIVELRSFQTHDARHGTRRRPIAHVHDFFAKFGKGGSLIFVGEAERDNAGSVDHAQ